MLDTVGTVGKVTGQNRCFQQEMHVEPPVPTPAETLAPRGAPALQLEGQAEPLSTQEKEWAQGEAAGRGEGSQQWLESIPAAAVTGSEHTDTWMTSSDAFFTWGSPNTAQSI